MKTFRYITIAVAALSFTFVSCVKDDLYSTPHPDRGALVVMPDFSKRTEGVVVPQQYVLSVGGNACEAPALQQFCYPELLVPAEYVITGYTVPDGVTVADGIATVDRLADGTFAPLPGYLFACSTSAAVVADDTTRVKMPMSQRVRDLYIKLTVTEGEVGRVSDVKGTISGIVGEVDIVRNAATVSGTGSVVTDFTVNGTEVVAHVRLLGVDGGRQTLSLEVAFNDGRSQRVESDLTDMLQTFNAADMTEPVEIRGNLLLPIAVGFDITITDLETDEVEDVDLY